MRTHSVLLLNCLALAAFAQTPETADATSQPTKSQFTYQLALTLKMLGDEQFLVGNTKDAGQAYDRAAAQLKDLAATPGDIEATDIELLSSEVQYRSMLLARNLDFWGGSFGQRENNPVTFLNRMSDDVKSLKDAGDEVARQVALAVGANDKITDLHALEQEVDTKMDVANLEEAKQENVEEYHARRVQELKDRLSQIAERRQFWADEADKAVKTLRHLEDAGNNIILGAVSEMTGLPVNLSTIGKGSLQDQILNTGLGMLNDPNSGLSTAIKGVSQQTNQLVELYQQANEVKKRIDDGVATVKQVENVLRQPTLEGLLKAGNVVYGQLPGDAKSGILQVVSEQKPLVALVELARAPGQVRTAALQFVAGQNGFADRLDSLLNDAIDARTADIKTWYSDVASRVASLKLDIAGEQEVADRLARSWAADFLKALPPEGVDTLKVLAHKDTVEDLAAYLSAQGIKQLPQVTIDGQHLKISGTTVDVALPDIGAKIKPEDIQGTADNLKQQAKGLFDVLKKQNQSAMDLLLNELPLNAVEAEIARVLPQNGAATPALRGPAFDAILSKLPDTAAKAAAMDQLAGMNVGEMVSSGAFSRTTGAPVSGSDDFSQTSTYLAGNPPQQPSDAQQQMLKSAVTGALSAAFPAAGVALKLVDFASNLFSMGEQIKKVDEARQEIQQLIVEELHLHDVVEESRLNLALAEIDQRIARATAKGASTQAQTYRTGIEFQAQNLTNAAGRAQLQAELFFYQAEMLRRDFDSLDRSLAMWLGGAQSPRGKIAELVQSDPQNVRYALDSEIHLFDWLNPDLAGQREDLAALVTHWQKLLAIATNVCRDHGCTMDSNHPGQIEGTEPVKLSTIVTKETWKDFLAWQMNPQGRSLTLWFLIQPGLQLTSPKHKNVRLVDVRLGGINSSGARVTLHQFSLAHTGVGYIPQGDHFVRDVLPPEHAESLDPPSGFDRDRLMRRWFEAGGAISKFEGYSMLTAWSLTLEPQTLNLELKDLELAFAYEYFADDSTPVVPDQLQTSLGTLVGGAQLEMLGSTPEILQKLSRWSQADASADKIPALNYSMTPKGTAQ